MALRVFPDAIVKVTEESPLPSPEIDALQLVLPDIVPGLAVTCLLIVTGFFNLKFDDTLNAFYTPTKTLRSAEMLYNKISNLPSASPKFITVTADNQENLLQEEEKITDSLFTTTIYSR